MSAACAYQQRPRTTAAKPPEAGRSVETTGAESWKVPVDGLVRFPSGEVEFIAGPQLKSGSPSNPAPWFDQTAFEKGLQHGEAFPPAPPSAKLTGTVSVNRNSNVITGVGTKFLSDFPGNISTIGYHVLVTDAAGVARDYILRSVESDTSLTVSLPWQQASASGLSFSKVTAQDLDAYINSNYYDLALVEYVNHYRTGDARFLNHARKIADSWWKLPALAEGKANPEDGPAPRNVSLNGLILRALDGRPEMWPWITEYTRVHFHTWVGQAVGWYNALSDAQIRGEAPDNNGKLEKKGFYQGVRDPGYMLLYAANLARVHPDAAVRAEFRQKALEGAVKYYARLQGADGGFYFNLDDINDTTQPFQIGILAEGLIAVHRLTGDERVKRAILKSAEHQFNRAYSRKGWRGMYYFVGGAFKGGASCETGCGAASNRFPPQDTNLIAEARQLNSTVVHHFGYAFLISGDDKYRRWGDEIFDATYSGADGYRGLAASRAKEYDEAYRSAGKYLAWRLAHGAPQATGLPPAAPSAPGAAPAVAADTSPHALIAAALTEALKLSSGPASSEAQVRALLGQIEGARRVIAAGRGRLSKPSEALAELEAASEHARTALNMVTSANGSGEEARLRVSWAAARLKRAGERIQSAPDSGRPDQPGRP